MSVEQGITENPPPTLEEPAKADHFELNTLTENDQVFKQISIDFKKAGLKATKVELLSYRKLWDRYTTTSRWILEDRKKTDPNFCLNERYLYHGTSVPKDEISEEGLDHRMSKEGCFGKGIYFSDYPKKCVKYAERGDTREHYILLVRVILGEAKVFPKGRKDRTLTCEPRKESSEGGSKFYDSVEGCPVNHKEFVVYQKERTLVEGFIAYVKDKKPKDTSQGEEEEEESQELSDDESDTDSCTDLSDNDEEALSGEVGSDTDSSDEDGENVDNEDSDSDSDADGDDQVEDTLPEKTDEEIEQLLTQKRRQFSEKTGVTNEFEVDRYLLLGCMNLNDAVAEYKKKEAAGFPESDEEEDTTPPRPLPGSEEWKKLDAEARQAIINDQIDDFMAITGMDAEKRNEAKKSLEAVNMDLKQAIIDYYSNLTE